MLKILNCAGADLTARLGGLFCADKQVEGFYLIKRGTAIDPATFTKTALDTLIGEDKAIGMIKFFSAEDNDQEADYATSSTKQRRKTVEGTKGFRFIFDANGCYQNELAKLDGSTAYGIWIVYTDGSAKFGVRRDAKLIGFDVNLFVGLKREQISADVAGSTLEVDITPSGTALWQTSTAVYTATDFDFNQVNPIEGIRVELPILTDGQTSITFKVVNACSGSAVTGLSTVANWKMLRNGVAENITALTEIAGTGQYTATVTALDAAQVIDFDISVNGKPIYILDTSYYGISVRNPKTVA